MKLTQGNLGKAILPKDKTDHIFWDDDLPGFGLRIREGGSRNYVVQYKVGKKTRRMVIGPIKRLTPEEARKQAKKELGKVSLGQDPQGEKAATKATATETFGAVAERFLTFQAKHLRPSSLYSTSLYLQQYCRRLHGLKLDTVTRREIASMLSTIAEKHGDVSADRARAALSAFFAWAMREGLCEANPVIGTNVYAGATSRDRKLTDAELAAVWLALDRNDYGDIVRLLILTGQRSDEIAKLRRSEVHDRVLDLPAERTKNGRPHIVPLSDIAYQVIEPHLGRDWLFGRRGTGFSGWSKEKKLLDAKLKIPAWQLRDIRRTVATGMAELGVEPHIVEACLNHVSGHKAGVAGIYNKATYLPPKTAALSLWENHVATIVAQAQGANVSRLRPKCVA